MSLIGALEKCVNSTGDDGTLLIYSGATGILRDDFALVFYSCASKTIT